MWLYIVFMSGTPAEVVRVVWMIRFRYLGEAAGAQVSTVCTCIYEGY